jgi:hypothetical protein
VAKDAFDGGDALNLVERIFELRICGVNVGKARHITGLHVLKEMHHLL